jgi:hypothetical protein
VPSYLPERRSPSHEFITSIFDTTQPVAQNTIL